MISYAPVVMFAYERMECLRRTYMSLRKNDLASETELFIFSDAPSEKNANFKAVEEVRNFLKTIEYDDAFRAIHIKYSETHKGLANSVIGGVTQIIEEYGKAIVVEDDLLTAKSFLRFMNQALNYYASDESVWSISGFTLPFHILKKYESDVYGRWRSSSWGWGTWKNRWEKVDWNVSDYETFISDQELIKKFNEGGEDMTNMLRAQQEGRIDSWAIRWDYQQFKEKMITIYPTKSQVKNIGWDGAGTNCKKSILNIWNTRLEEYPGTIKFEKCTVDARLMKKTRRAYSSKLLQRIILKIDTW